MATSNPITKPLSQAFLDAVNNLGEKIDIDQIKTLLQQGRVAEAIKLVEA
jgi:CII-binding regulator of phage lambda lysogenization HflD